MSAASVRRPCVHCPAQVEQRPDGTWVHRGSRLQLCTPLGMRVAEVADPEPREESCG